MVSLWHALFIQQRFCKTLKDREALSTILREKKEELIEKVHSAICCTWVIRYILML